MVVDVDMTGIVSFSLRGTFLAWPSISCSFSASSVESSGQVQTELWRTLSLVGFAEMTNCLESVTERGARTWTINELGKLNVGQVLLLNYTESFFPLYKMVFKTTSQKHKKHIIEQVSSDHGARCE